MLKVRSRSSVIPYIVEVYDAELPESAPRVVARCDTRTGQVWRCPGTAVKTTMREIRAALKGA